MADTVPAGPVRLRVEGLEARSTPSVTIRFDYTYDQSGVFDSPAARAALRRAAEAIGPHLESDLAAITPAGGNGWRASVADPASGSLITLNNPTIPAGEIEVFVAAARLPDGTLAASSTGGAVATGDPAWQQTVYSRGVPGAGTWGGMMTFAVGPDFYYGAGRPAPGQYDFTTVAEHELIHLLGFGPGNPAFSRAVAGGAFTGPTAEAVAGGPVPLAAAAGGPADHWAPGTGVAGRESPMAPSLPPGVKRPPTALDFAALHDVGWAVSGWDDGPPVPPAGPARGPIPSRTSELAADPEGAADPTAAGGVPFAVGSGGTVVTVGPDGLPTGSFVPFAGFTGLVRVAEADVTGDGIPDVIVGSGPGRVAEVKVFDGRTGAELDSFLPFEGSFEGGVFVAAADFTGDGRADIVVSPDQGGGPVVAVYDGAGAARGRTAQAARFLGLSDPNFRGGLRVAVGDVNGDETPDLVIAAGAGGGPRVSILDGTNLLSVQPRPLIPDFYAFEPGLRNGAYVATADLEGNGYADLVFGAGPGGGPRVTAVSGWDLVQNGPAAALGNPVANFYSGDTSQRDGVPVAAVDAGGGVPRIVAGDWQSGQFAIYTPGPAGLTAVGQQVVPAVQAPTPVASPVSAPSATPSTGDRVAAFAAAKLGTAVSAPNAEGCTGLVVAALAAAGAAPQSALGTAGPVADHYVWGDLIYQRSGLNGYGSVGNLSDLRPGDIIQFDDYAEQSDGGSVSAPHHTAVVESIDPTTGRVNVFQQNWNGNPTVTQGQFNPAAMTAGVASVYRPVS